MHAYLAVALALFATALCSSKDRDGNLRDIDATISNQVPKLFDYVLNHEYLAAQNNRAKLVTKPRPDDVVVADHVILESNVVTVVRPTKKGEAIGNNDSILVRQRRGYNLENVRVPARYPYLPVPQYSRFRRWG